jgi:hypothetical protein
MSIGVAYVSSFAELSNINWYGPGDIAYNMTPTVLGTPGSRYTILGWRRLTPRGAGNVLGVDWVEMRVLTGT